MDGKWYFTETKGSRTKGYLSMEVRETKTGRLVADIPLEPLSNSGAVERTRRETDLIAAAPELLEACETLLAEWEAIERADGIERGQREVVMARAAIAKAKGEA